MKIKKLAVISVASLMLISTYTTLLNTTNTTTQTVLAAKKKKSQKSKKSKTKKAKSPEKKFFNDLKHTLYHGDETYSGPKPNPQLEKILKKIAKNTYKSQDEEGFNVYFKAKRDTTCYYDKTDYEDYDENGDPIKPNQLGTYKVKKGEIIKLFNPYLQLTDKPFLGRNLFKNKAILIGYDNDDDSNSIEYHYYINDFKVIKEGK